MTLRRLCFTIALALAQAGAAPAAAQVLDLPGNAELTLETETAAGSYDLPIGGWSDGAVPVVPVEGAVTRQAWRIPVAGLATLEVVAPLRRQLRAAGYEVLFECATDSCGGFDFRFSTEVLPAPHMYVDLGNYRFLAARREGEAGAEAVSLMVSSNTREGYVQVIRAVPAGASAPSLAQASAPVVRRDVPRDLGAFGAELEQEGRVVLTDLSFATGSAQLGAGPYASLSALAGYLAANPDRRVALVGHTDSEGSLDGNITLSRRRAGSVLERLVETHGTRRAQLDAQGMGYLAPLASNLTAEGREANRRVEVIITSTE